MTKMEPVREQDIRSLLLEHISADADDFSKIHEEFRIERGGSRVDVAVIGKKLIAYEIKSDLDSFVRLANQIHAYNRVFDEIYLACGASHTNQALCIIPSWWGLLVAERTDTGAPTLKVLREAVTNIKQDPFSLASLLWRDEASAILTSIAKDVPQKASCHVLWDSISKSLPLERIRCLVSATLLERDYNKLAVKTM